MPRYPVRDCDCEDFPCCIHADNFPITPEEDAYFDGLDDFDEQYDEERFDDEEADCCCDCLSDPCVCDQLHDMAVEDRIGGTGYDY